MPKRISKKLLVGLGSIITFGTVGTVSGFGIKSIIDSTWNNRDINQLNSSNPVTSFNNIPDFNVATKDMFIKTKNLKRFHFGNTQIGQKVTPWGWLGVFEDDNNVKTRIALTGWNGEIIWVNEDYPTLDELNVYDMQYDFGSNLIFVLRTKANNGFYDGNEMYPEVYLEVLDAKTGKKYKDDVEDKEFMYLQQAAKTKLINDTSLLDGYETDENIRKKTKNLYYLDLTYSSHKNAILATWMPNYMQMARQKYKGDQIGSLPSFQDVINTWDEVATSFMFSTEKLSKNETYKNKKRQFKLVKSSGITEDKDSQGKSIFWIKQSILDNTKGIKAENIFLLANPFFTTSHDGNAFVMHLIGATELGAVFHKTIGWKIDLNDSANKDGDVYEYTGGSTTTDRKKYDNIQILEPNKGLFELKINDQSWTMAKGWEPSFISANLRVNKNMFDENSIIFAYPYSSSSLVKSPSNGDEKYGNLNKAMPVFNVAQIWLNKDGGFIKEPPKDSKKIKQKDHINYNLGKQIDDYYQENGDNYGKNPELNYIYPYPTPAEFDDKNINHSYNRLISVSPFDNTIIYSAKPNSGENIFASHTKPNKDKWAGFWIGNRWRDVRNKKIYHPLIVANDPSIVSTSDTFDSIGMQKMLSNINDLYHDGFTFDIASFYESESNKYKLNLYFNQTGSGSSISYDNKDQDFKTSKIGLIRDIIYESGSHQDGQLGSKGWGENIVKKYPFEWDDVAKKLFATTINNDSFSSLIHSRADLTKWYPRTWANLNWPSNMLRAGEIFSYQAPWKFAVATEFNKQLVDQDWVFGNKESMDLVSAWRDSGETNDSTKYRKRFDRLIMKRPTIKAGSSALKNGLNLDVSYQLSMDIFNKIIQKPGWEINGDEARNNLTLTQNIAVQNTSVQILSAWGDSYKMKKITETTSSINSSNTYWNEEVIVTEILDRKDNESIGFGGKNNNNITSDKNNSTVLRLMLKLVKPTGNLPQWFRGINESTFFNKAYPIEAAFTGETTFKDIVEKFANERARLMDLSQESNAAVGLGNLKIEASLDLNPKFGQYTSTDKFYNGPSGKILIDKTTKQKFIYTDNRSINRIIYDQSSTDYPSFTTNGGFGSSTTDSWSNPNDLNGLTNIKVTTDYSKLADKLVRKNAGDTTPIFSFDYQNGKKDVLEITPTQGDSNWFINHFKNYNRMIGLFVQFQYQLSGSNQWINLNTPLSDADISSNLQANQNKLLIQKAPINIKKLRFKLVTKQGETNPVIDMQNFQANDDKYISDAHQIASEKYIIKTNQIKDVPFIKGIHYINDITETNINSYIREVVNASDSSADIKSKVTLKFEYNGQKDLTAKQLFDKLQQQINSPTPFAISSDENYAHGGVIKAYFSTKNSGDGITFINEDGSAANNNDLKDVVTYNLKTKIALKPYLDQLNTDGLIVKRQPTNPGQFVTNGSDIQFPSNKAQSGFLSAMSFEQIKNALAAVGVSIRYKGYDPNAQDFGNWQNDITSITNYDPTNPQIKIGFKVEQNWNVAVFNDQAIGENDEFAIKLNLPKQINISDDYLNTIESGLDFSGDTKNINFTESKVSAFIQNILTKNDQDAGTTDVFTKAKLKMFFNVGGSGWIETSELKTQLKSKWTDLKSRDIKYKFELDSSQQNDFILASPNQIYELYDEDNSPLKIYINDKYQANDKGLFQSLKATKVSGSNTNLTLTFIDNIDVDKTSGILTATSPDRGKGLKVEFTFNKDLIGNESTTGSNIETDWVGEMPKSFDTKYTDSGLFLRITLTDQTKYTYDHQNTKFKLDLSSIPLQININPQWLSQSFSANNEIDLNDETKLKESFKQYESSVFAAANSLSEVDKKKIIIKYTFNQKENLTIDELIKEIKNYQNTTKSQTTILQLWNGTSGQKISAKFDKAQADGNYELVVPAGSENKFDINFEKVITEIDFSKVITWLTQTPKLVQVSGTSPNAVFSIPQVSAAGDTIFNGKQWQEVTDTLKQFGITIQYYEVLGTNQPSDSDWKDNLAQVTKYDPNIGKIQIRFKFNNGEAKNIKFKTDLNQTYPGNNTTATPSFQLSLNIRLIIKVNPDIVEKFINKPDVIKGNTKYLKIKADAEKEMIDKIKQENATINSEFNKANLIVKYKLDQSPDDWKTREDFINTLQANNTDQRSNKVLFKFDVVNNQEFEVDGAEKTLFDPTTVTDHEQWKVKIFINDGTWEKDAATVSVTGKTSGITWDWQKLKVKENNGKVGTDQLQVEFSAKNGANYDDGAVTENPNDLTTGWITVKPNRIDPTVQNLYIRIKAKAGYVYGPSYNEDGHTKTAKAHNVNLQIKREILVNPKDLSTSLSMTGTQGFVSDITKGIIDKFIDEAIKKIQIQDHQQYVTVKFNFNDKQGLDSESLYQEIRNIISSNQDPYYGVLQLWNDSVGKKIEAYYDLKDGYDNAYELITTDVNIKPNAAQTVITGHIKTKIDLKDIVADLKTKKIEVVSTTKNHNLRNIVPVQGWKMPSTKVGITSLHGLEWEIFEKRLKEVGVLVEAKMVTNGNNNDWKPLSQLKTYDDTTLKIALRFRIEADGSNIVLSVDNGADTEYDQPNNSFTSEFEMNIKAPATVVVNPDFVNKFKDSYQLGGNTKYIELDENAENELINKIVEQNLVTNPTAFQELKSRLSIEYYLGRDGNTISDDQWQNRVDFKKTLEETNIDQTTNEIWFRLNVKNPTNNPDAQIFHIDKTPKILSDHNISATAKVKIYINDTGFTDRIETLKAVGSTDGFTITGLDDWKRTIPTGLEVWWSKETNPSNDNDTGWDKNEPTTLNPDKKLWVRFKVQAGYEFESARKDKPEYSEKQEINTEGITVIIKLQKAWLEKIIMTGNFKEPGINEDNVMGQIKPDILPPDKPDLIHLEYRIKSTNEWLDKEKFLQKLRDLNGAKDNNNFILKREELEVRFAIKENENQYGLEIDNVIISNENRDNFNLQIIDDTLNRNDSFTGIINLDLIKDFIVANFKVQGSTSKPELIITNKQAMDTLFMPYRSDGLFDVIYSTIYNEKNQTWDWSQKDNSILKNGQFIEPKDLYQLLHATIGPKKKFAIKFISKKDKYKVYKDDTKHDDGYILDLSNNVKITIEITNPFTTAQKTLGIWTREDNKQGHYYQGQGGFKIVVADLNSLEVDSNNTIESAEQFLQNSGLADNEKAALELVFHNFGSSAPEAEIERVKKAITNYNDDTWKSFNSVKDNNSDWSKNLELKVGDYVAVALRVKEQYARKDDPFVLKDEDYSMILPVMQDTSGADKSPGRISGYKIKTDAIQIQNGSLILTNVFSSQLPPLDGWTELQQLSLVKDDLGNYLGVNLSLQLYTEFHKDKNGEVLFSGSGANLVKRESGSNTEITGYYKDNSGKNIKDDKGQDIPIYKDKITKRLSAPIKSNTKRNKLFTHLGDGIFRLQKPANIQEQALFSLFRNQAIDLKIEASLGQGTSDLPDFYLDTTQEKLIQLQDQISPQIKFPVENEKKISYGWNYEDFAVDKVKYKHPSGVPDKKPEDGNAQLDTKFKLIRKEGQNSQEITGNSIEEAVKIIKEQLEKDFQNQLKFQTTYFDSKGNKVEKDGNDIYEFKELKNKDRIVLKIVAVAEDLFYVNEQQALVINVNGLTQAAPNQEKMQYLRVKQGGLIDGQGSFKVLVSNPDNPDEDEREILKGWKFMIRVWDKNKDENGKPQVKIPWSDDPARIRGLANGDKVEWKLVSSDGNPVKDAYYNTIALRHDQNDGGNIDYQFAQVNYPNGQTSYEVFQEGIGDYPANDDQYPENSGFVISGLQPEFKVFKIDQPIFEKIIQELNPFYVGFDHQGTINFDNKYLENDYWVNTKGEIYLKDQAPAKLTNEIEELPEIQIKDFIDKITFFTQDPVLFPYQNGFKFSGNDVNISNHLANGDQVWAQFNMIDADDENSTINTNENLDAITIKLADVSGLKNASDPMSPLWYVLMALAGILTLGTASLIAYLIARNRKLNGKN